MAAMRSLPSTVIAELSPRFGVSPEALRFLGGGKEWSDGSLYTFRARDGDRVLKFLCFPEADGEGLERAEDRIRCVRFFGERGCRIVTPEPSAEGALFQTCIRDGFSWLAYAYRKVPGRVVEKGDASYRSGAYFRAVGEVLGGLHAAWESRGEVALRDGSSASSRVLRGWRDEWSGFRSWCRDDEVGRAWERLGDELGSVPVDADGYGFVHNDAHVWNLLFDPGAEPARGGGEPALTVIDFDVSTFHWFGCDIATALYSFHMLGAGRPDPPPFSALGDAASASFLEGYRRRREPGQAWLERLELFLQYRRILLFTVFQGETDKHPAWKARWREGILNEDVRLFGGR